MALTQKQVFYALVRNHKTNTKDLCAEVDITYNKLAKRLTRGTVHEMDIMDTGRISMALSVSMDSFLTLMTDAAEGKFPDDYPQEQIVLEKVSNAYLKERTEVEFLTPEELELIQKYRAAQKRAAESAVLSVTGRNKHDDKK